jgi:hypothetical protein
MIVTLSTLAMGYLYRVMLEKVSVPAKSGKARLHHKHLSDIHRVA